MRVDKMLSQMYGYGARHGRTADAKSGGRLAEWRRSLARRWPSLDKVFNNGGRGRVAIATGFLCCLGVAAIGEAVPATDAPIKPVESAAIGATIAERARARAEQPASRSFHRTAPTVSAKPPAAKKPAPKKPAPKPPAAKKPAPKPAPKKPAPKKPAPKKPAPKKPAPRKAPAVRPVAGLTQAQMNNAAVIVRTAQKMRMPKRAAVIAVATAMQESQLYNLASDVIPESMRYPHQGTGADHDSVGLFQQRSTAGWGSVRNLMRPDYAATQFLAALRNVPGWQRMALTYAAQAVQYSAYPGAYAKHEGRANAVVNALVR
jgi:hypothetical protein